MTVSKDLKHSNKGCGLGWVQNGKCNTFFIFLDSQLSEIKSVECLYDSCLISLVGTVGTVGSVGSVDSSRKRDLRLLSQENV